LSQSLKRCWSDDNISVNETKRAAATPRIGSAAKLIKRVPSQICIRNRYSIPLWPWECLSYLRSEYTLTTNLSLQPGGMDISLDRTIVLPHCIFILFASLCLRMLVLAFIGIKGFRYSLMSRCPFNMVLASTETIVYFRLDCRVLAGRYA
jgi:hypothetical protein